MYEFLVNIQTPKAKRIFFFASTILYILEFVALTLVHHYYDSTPNLLSSITKEVLIELIATTTAAIILLIILIYLIPIEKTLNSINILHSSSTKNEHLKTLELSDFWLHNGHLGRWVRTTAMPHFAKKSKEREFPTKARLIILNPKNNQVCELYLKYRQLIAFKENNINDIEDVQAELLTTIIMGQIFNQDNSNNLDVKIYLSNHLDLVREDINNIAAFRTHVNPHCPSIVYYNRNQEKESSEFYNTAKTNFDYNAEFCTPIKFKDKIPSNKLSTTIIKSYLTDMDMLIKDDEKFLKNILSRINSDFNPYK